MDPCEQILQISPNLLNFTRVINFTPSLLSTLYSLYKLTYYEFSNSLNICFLSLINSFQKPTMISSTWTPETQFRSEPNPLLFTDTTDKNLKNCAKTE